MLVPGTFGVQDHSQILDLILQLKILTMKYKRFEPCIILQLLNGTMDLMYVVPYILVTCAFIQFQLDVLYALFLEK
jgi:hypothetical protein